MGTLLLPLEDLSLYAQCLQPLVLLVWNFVHEVEQHLEGFLDLREQTVGPSCLLVHVAIIRVDGAIAKGLEDFEELGVQFQGPLGSGTFFNIPRKSSYLCPTGVRFIPLPEKNMLKSASKHSNGRTVGTNRLRLVSFVKIERYCGRVLRVVSPPRQLGRTAREGPTGPG